MEFWKVAHSGEAPAAIDARGGKQWNYAELRKEVARIQTALPALGRKSLGLLLAKNSFECLTTYLAALNAGSALILLDSSLNQELLREFLVVYQPDWIFTGDPGIEFAGYRRAKSKVPGLLENETAHDLEIHQDLALLLATSGSTGSPKLVRLTLDNLAANADSIAQYLQLSPHDRPITSLPMSYSYGLSVINSHLSVGASIVLTNDGVLQRGFWDSLDSYRCNSFAGVPYTYQMLLQTGLLNQKGPTLTMLTQAGGRLEEGYIQQIHKLAVVRGWRFFVMYGQTEATARISYVPFEKLGGKIGSVGIAIPGGSLTVDDATEELVYRGSNVMMGYAESPLDLSKGDELQGVLRTGDLARQDNDGYFYITGRLKRFLKMFGKRFNLDDIEQALAQRCDTAVACFGRDDLLMLAVEKCENAEAVRSVVCETFDLPRPAVKVVVVDALPRTPNGKVDYKRLAEPDRENVTTMC